MKVKITVFTIGGEYHNEYYYESPYDNWNDVILEIGNKLMERRIPDHESEYSFHVMIKNKDDQYGPPRLFLRLYEHEPLSVRRYTHGPTNRITARTSKYRFVLEARTEEGLTWCGSHSSLNHALANKDRLRSDWTYQVFDAHLQKIIWAQS